MNSQKYKILLIEDDRLDQMAFERLVKQENLPYEYSIAGSVADAKQKINPDNFDIFIADYNLGDGTIFDVMDLMKNVPTIITTGAGGEDIAAKAMRKGVFDYLIKDVDRNYLKVIPILIENAIKHKKINDQIKMLSHAMKSISDSVYITDKKNKIIFANKSFYTTYGFLEKEILQKSPEVFQKDTYKNNAKGNPVVNKDLSDEYYHFRKNGSKFPVSLSRSGILDDYAVEIATVWVARDITERKRVEQGMRNLVSELQDALAKVKTLSGFIPICASCKKIRDDKGYWNQIEQYIKKHSDAEFSHSVCPDCAKKLYPDLNLDNL